MSLKYLRCLFDPTKSASVHYENHTTKIMLSVAVGDEERKHIKYTLISMTSEMPPSDIPIVQYNFLNIENLGNLVDRVLRKGTCMAAKHRPSKGFFNV